MCWSCIRKGFKHSALKARPTLPSVHTCLGKDIMVLRNDHHGRLRNRPTVGHPYLRAGATQHCQCHLPMSNTTQHAAGHLCLRIGAAQCQNYLSSYTGSSLLCLHASHSCLRTGAACTQLSPFTGGSLFRHVGHLGLRSGAARSHLIFRTGISLFGHLAGHPRLRVGAALVPRCHILTKTYPLRSHSGDRAKQLARPPWSARAPTRTRSSLHETVAKCSFSVGSVQDRHWPQQGVSMSADLSSTDKELHIRKPDVGKRSSCDAELDHTILTDLLTDAKCSPSIHQLLNVPWSPLPRIHAPPPRAVYEVLLDQNRSGQNIGMLLDQVSRSRAAYSVRDSSQSTYASHLRTICLVCSLLKVPVVPTNLLTIRRYTGVCNNPVTLRGHLAAWKLVHIVFGEPWPGDRDPFIRAVQAGIVRLQPPKSPKMAVRIDLCEKIVRYAFSEIGQDQSFGIMASLAYLFALRVPSELLRQGGLRILHWHENTWTYGPVIRKGSSTPTFIRRRCICNSKYYLMCPHYWWNQFRMISVRRQKPFTAWTCNSFNQRLREVLVAVGIQPTQAGNYTSHDFRRGCAKDILAQTGLQAMMSHCGWKSLGAAHHYVSKDEVDEAMLATLLAEGSDEDV